MNGRFSNTRKLAGLAAMATLVTTAGWGLVSGAAQADAGHPDDYGCFNHCFHDDHHGDFYRGRDRDFFDHHDRDFFFNPFFGGFFGHYR